MKQSLWNKRIPNLLIFVFLIGAFLLTTQLVKNPTNFSIKAGPSQDPQDVKITNISDTSFTVSYTTSDNVLGDISYNSKTGNSTLVLDDRDKDSKTPSNHTIHHISVYGLTPNSKYSFTILSGSSTYENNGSPYTVTTGQTLSSSASAQILSGTVIFPDQSNTEAVVYVNFIGSQTLSALVQKNGSYALDLSKIRNNQLTSYFDITSSVGTVLVRGVNQQTTAQFNSDQGLTLPAISLGSTYDFSQNTTLLNTSATNSAGLTLQNVTPIPSGKVTITTPSEGQAFSEQKPTFIGTAAPAVNVTLVIDSALTPNSSFKSDSLGNWQYTPTKSLTPGQHTLTVTAKDSLGIIRNSSAIFYIYASGSTFLEPSVSPIQTTETPTPTLTPTSDPSPTLTPTPTPQITATPLPSPTLTVINVSPILSPTAALIAQTTIIPSATPASQTPVTGSNSALLGAIIAFIPVLLGGLLIYLSRGIIL
ncbi:MAG TPA: Ig-like domain-containing protein [Patescibacteria group bacterium]|nr:Ig-like domain-containing protein [Patescibacteria group bacterium]